MTEHKKSLYTRELIQMRPNMAPKVRPLGPQPDPYTRQKPNPVPFKK